MDNNVNVQTSDEHIKRDTLSSVSKDIIVIMMLREIIAERDRKAN